MLILTRRINESIKIGDNVTLSVLAIRGNQVRLGIEAPREIPVHRDEIYQRILAEREQENAEKNSNEQDTEEMTPLHGAKVRYLD